jgi:hypothetical protein
LENLDDDDDDDDDDGDDDDNDDDDDDEDINSTSESIKGSVKASATGYYESKRHKPWFDEECSKLLDPRKLTNCNGCRIEVKNMEINLNNVRRETIRTFRKKRGSI